MDGCWRIYQRQSVSDETINSFFDELTRIGIGEVPPENMDNSECKDCEGQAMRAVKVDRTIDK